MFSAKIFLRAKNFSSLRADVDRIEFVRAL
jgi:hypothetical protein